MPQLIPIYKERNEVSVYPLEAYATGCYLKVVTRNDPAINPITLSCNNSTWISGRGLTMTPYGRAWVGEIDVTGLVELKHYPWTVSQAAFNDSGHCNRLPQVGEPHIVIVYSCDNNTGLSNPANANPQVVTNLWDTIYDLWHGDTFVSGIVGLDDWSGYIDQQSLDDSYDGTCSGFSTVNTLQSNLATTNDLSLLMLGYCGCLGSTNSVVSGDFDGDSPSLRTHWAREFNRDFMRKNSPKKVVNGDHEYYSDGGYLVDMTIGSNSRWDNYATKVDGIGKVMHDLFMVTAGHTLCNAGVNNSFSNHWSYQAGNIKFLAYDVISNGTGIVTGYNSVPPEQLVDVYSNGQLSDIKAEAHNSDAPFKINCCPSGLIYPADGATSLFNHLAQYPLYNHCRAEFDFLMTEKTNSLMSDRRTNGVLGCSIFISGDLHRRTVSEIRNKSFALNHDLDLDHWHTGCMASINFNNNTGLEVGDTFESTDNVVKVKLVDDEELTSGKRFSFITLEDVPNTAKGNKLIISNYNTAGEIAHQKQYFQGGGNRGYDMATKPAYGAVAMGED